MPPCLSLIISYSFYQAHSILTELLDYLLWTPWQSLLSLAYLSDLVKGAKDDLTMTNKRKEQ